MSIREPTFRLERNYGLQSVGLVEEIKNIGSLPGIHRGRACSVVKPADSWLAAQGENSERWWASACAEARAAQLVGLQRVDGMKRLTPHPTWWHRLPHRETALYRRTEEGPAMECEQCTRDQAAGPILTF